MQPRTHLITSALAGLALYPRSPRRAALLTLAGVLLDVDHYLLYALRSGDWNPLGALYYNRWRGERIQRGDTRPRYGGLRSVLHRPNSTIPILGMLSIGWPALWPVFAGIALHLLLDAPLALRFDWRAWRRARGRCERCGIGGLARDVFYIVPPHQGGARWSLANRAVWCYTCAREVYSRSGGEGM